VADVSGGGAESGLHRVLKPRHLTMIAIGGSIGTGLFLASGASVATAGPGATINWSGLAAPVLIASVSSIKRCGGNCG